MIQKKGNPITGARPQMRPSRNVLSDAADTSRDAQELVRATPSPFQNRQGPVNLPVASHPDFRVSGDFAKAAAKGATGRNVSMKNAPTVNFGAVGYANGPYKTRAGIHSVNSGFPMRGTQRVIGGGNQASAKEVRRIKQTYPGMRIGEWRP